MKPLIKQNYSRSPLFYVGDKHKLLSQIVPLFPDKRDRLIEPFVGGGSVFINTTDKQVLANDIDENVVALHRFISSYVGRPNLIIEQLTSLAQSYGLSCSFQKNDISPTLRKKFPKTYFAEFNRKNFNKLRADYNAADTKDPLQLYALLIYGFNRMLRFNSLGEFNIPVGNVDFNSNVIEALKEYISRLDGRRVEFSNRSFLDFFKQTEFTKGDFVYVDPPYLLTSSEYTKNWSVHLESQLYEAIDYLHDRGIKFALSNVVSYKQRRNPILKKWMGNYNVFVVRSNYINYFDNKKKSVSEVLVCNYG